MGFDDEAIRERIQKLIHLEGMSQREFAEKLERSPSNLSQTLSGSRRVPRGLIEDIIEKYPDIRKEWLLYGDGLMFKDIIDEELIIEDKTRPRVPMNATGLQINEFLNGTKCFMCEDMPLIRQFPDYDFTLVLNNDTMAPKYERGDEIALRTASVDSIDWGHEYLVETSYKEEPKFRKVYDRGDCFRLASYDSEKYPDVLVRKDFVIAVYKCVGMIRV